MALELPIKTVLIQEYPQAGRYSPTKYQACIYFTDGRKDEYCYGSTYKYKCTNYCSSYMFTKNHHTRAQKLLERGAYYKCRNCGGRLTYVCVE